MQEKALLPPVSSTRQHFDVVDPISMPANNMLLPHFSRIRAVAIGASFANACIMFKTVMTANV